MKYLILYNKNLQIGAAVCPRSPARVTLAGREFRLRHQSCWDFGYNRDESGALVGFYCIPASDEVQNRFYNSSFAKSSPWVVLHGDGSFTVRLGQPAQSGDDLELGTYGTLLEAEDGEAMIGLPEWLPWRRLGFDVHTPPDFTVEEWEP